MRRSKRVSFHQEVTVKEFIKKHGNSSAESDFSSPDLYRAPINHRGQDPDFQSSDDSAMELTETITPCSNLETDDSNMDLTDMSIQGPGELTVAFRDDKREYPNDASLLGESTEVAQARVIAHDVSAEHLDISLNTTSRGSYRNLNSLARKVLPGHPNINISMNTSHNISAQSNESESSTVRRSVRIAKRASSDGNDSIFKTPQINLQNNRKKGGSNSSRSKQKRNISLLSSGYLTDSKLCSNVSKMPSINLLENSGESSDISLASVSDSIVEKRAVEKEEMHKSLLKLREEKLAKLKDNAETIKMWVGKITVMEEKIKDAQIAYAHPYAVELLTILQSS
ncbi:hypothetical protein ACHWQZ_G013578 [Mnemiopsis leidyi]